MRALCIGSRRTPAISWKLQVQDAAQKSSSEPQASTLGWPVNFAKGRRAVGHAAGGQDDFMSIVQDEACFGAPAKQHFVWGTCCLCALREMAVPWRHVAIWASGQIQTRRVVPVDFEATGCGSKPFWDPILVGR